MKSLKRMQVGDFKIEDSITIEELQKIVENTEIENSELKKQIIPIEKIFENTPTIILDNRKLRLFLNGVMLTQANKDGVYKIYNEKDEFIGTGKIKNNLLKRDIIK